MVVMFPIKNNYHPSVARFMLFCMIKHVHWSILRYVRKYNLWSGCILWMIHKLADNVGGNIDQGMSLIFKNYRVSMAPYIPNNEKRHIF